MTFNVFVSYSEKDHIAAALVGTLRRANPSVRIFIAHQFRSPGLSIRQMDRIFKRPFLWPELYRSPGRVVNSFSA